MRDLRSEVERRFVGLKQKLGMKRSGGVRNDVDCTTDCCGRTLLKVVAK
jgi:hypothetical protein